MSSIIHVGRTMRMQVDFKDLKHYQEGQYWTGLTGVRWKIIEVDLFTQEVIFKRVGFFENLLLKLGWI